MQNGVNIRIFEEKPHVIDCLYQYNIHFDECIIGQCPNAS